MKYKPHNLMCRDRSHGQIEYKGNGDYECPVCGMTYHDDDYDDIDSEESLSVYDAAQIWLSNGMDEDYTFGYTEDELKRALR